MDSTTDLQLRSLEEAKSAFQQTIQRGTEAQVIDPITQPWNDPFEFAREIYMFVRGVDWRGYNRQLGQPIFYTGYTENVKNATLSSSLLHGKVEELASAKLEQEIEHGYLNPKSKSFALDKARRRAEIVESLEQIAGQMVDTMMCKMESKFFIRSAFYSATALLTRMYNGVHVSQKEVHRLLEYAAVAAQKKRPIIFLPRHTSHVDYITLHIVCYRLGITLPVVVAGDNLNFPLVGPFLQSTGAMWIRRSFDNDQLYTTMVQTYLDTLMQQGYNLECFIEGGRSRTGKLLGPKFGFLSFVLDSVLSGRTEDVYICPVSTQYDKVLEVDSYVSELLGKPKQKENLADFLSSSSVLNVNMGRIDCRFHEPWSLREFIDQQSARYNQGSRSVDLTNTARNSELRIRLLRTLGYRVLSDINNVSIVMPTALVGTVLLTLRGRGVGRAELARKVDWLAERIRANGGNVADFHGMPTGEIVSRALAVLGPNLVGRVEGLAEETFYAVDRFQLSFYRNMTIHLFISEALIAVAMYAIVKKGGGHASEQMSATELTEKVTFLSQLFRGEFIFPAGQGLQRNLEEAVDKLIRDNVLEASDRDGQRYIGLSPRERQEGRETFDFYCFLLWPFCDSAWLGAVSLLALVPPVDSPVSWIPVSTAQATAQLMGRTLYHQGDLSYFEAVNKEALKNAYARYQEEGIILQAKNQTKDKKTPPRLSIAPDWLPRRDPETHDVQAGGRLWEFIGRISEHRREGKNRRDGATVERRLLGLAQTLNKQLFTEHVGEADVDLQPTVEQQQHAAKARKGRRRSRL